MVPEGLLEGAALSASEPVADGNPEAEAEAAESAEVTVEGSTGFNWADASEDPPVPTAGFEVGGAASSALQEEADEDFDLLKFDALSLLDPVKPEGKSLLNSCSKHLRLTPIPPPSQLNSLRHPIKLKQKIISKVITPKI